MYDTATGQADLARLLKDLEGEDGGSIALQHLPANMPMAALVGCAIPTYGFSVDDFGKRAFDASNFGDKAGVFLSADEEEEAARKKGGGQTPAEEMDDLIDAMEDITEAQKEAMAAYRATWLREEQAYGNTTMTGQEIEDMNSKYQNDPRFRNSVHSRLRDNGMSVAEIMALEQASDRKRVLSQLPEHMRTASQQAEFQTLKTNNNLNEFEAVQADVNRELKVASDPSFAEKIERDAQKDFEVQTNNEQPENVIVSADIVEKQIPTAARLTPLG